jgi:hypothetical protein
MSNIDVNAGSMNKKSTLISTMVIITSLAVLFTYTCLVDYHDDRTAFAQNNQTTSDLQKSLVSQKLLY